MELRVLKYFLAVAQEQSISAAAEVLHVTQPTLSRQIQDLEYELGKRLFDRTNKKTVLTEDGIKLRRRAEDILAIVDQTTAEFHSTNEDLYGELRIGAGETDAMQLLCAAMNALHHKHAHVQYSIYSGIADDVIERLNHGSLDFGLLLEPVDKTDFNYIPVPISDQGGLLVLRNGPFCNLKSITPENIHAIPLFVGSRYGFAQSFSAWLGYDQKKLNIVGSFNLINNAAYMVKAGLGNAVTLEHLINITDSSLQFIPFEPPILHPMVLAWKKSPFLSDIGQLFLDEIKRVFAEAKNG